MQNQIQKYVLCNTHFKNAGNLNMSVSGPALGCHLRYSIKHSFQKTSASKYLY